MLKTRVMPCLLLNDGRLVKTVKFRKQSYVGDPVNAIKIYNEKEVDELILLDISATKNNAKPPFDVIAEVTSECFMPLAYGGGIRTIDDARKIFQLGVEKIAVNSYAIENPLFIKEVSDKFGSQSVIVSIDVKKKMFGKYVVCSHGGTRATRSDPPAFARRMVELGAGEILINSIDRDGTMDGFDLEIVKEISEAVDIPVIACGGAGSVEDVGEVVKTGGASAVAAGSLFVYQGKNRSVLINFPTQEELAAVLE